MDPHFAEVAKACLVAVAAGELLWRHWHWWQLVRWQGAPRAQAASSRRQLRLWAECQAAIICKLRRHQYTWQRAKRQEASQVQVASSQRQLRLQTKCQAATICRLPQRRVMRHQSTESACCTLSLLTELLPRPGAAR